MQKTKKFLFYILLAALILTFLVSSYVLLRHYLSRQTEQKALDQLVSDMDTPQTSTSLGQALSPKEQRRSSLQQLADQNPDLIGWLSIEGTGIDLPVMQTPSNPEYYLRTNFEHKYSISGLPFLDGSASLDPQSDNLIIYGHHMKDGTMFQPLMNYLDQDFLEHNPYIIFETLVHSPQTYQIMAVFSIGVDDPGHFRYYDYINTSEESFNEYMQQVKERSYYDTGIQAVYGDKLLTLSTCEYSHKDGRLVVVAKQIS